MKKRLYSTDQSFKKLAKLNLHLIILVLSFIGNAQTQSAPPKEIILLIGQSNMAGRANLMDRDYEIVQNAFLLDSINEWTPLKSPLNIHSSIRKVAGMQRYNLGYSFAREVLNNNILSPLGLVVNARGGTKIDQWVPGTHYFNEAIRRSKSAIGSQGKIIATFWLQGESNLSDKDPGYKSYFEKLKSIIHGLRKQLNNDQMIFIASELNKDQPENTVFKKMLDRLNTEVPLATTVKSVGTSTYDGTHYDHKSLEVLGKRFATKFRELYQKQYQIK
ncbi:MAG: sialate O-acetylesterase [Flavobacteriaceae bacterium]